MGGGDWIRVGSHKPAGDWRANNVHAKKAADSKHSNINEAVKAAEARPGEELIIVNKDGSASVHVLDIDGHMFDSAENKYVQAKELNRSSEEPTDELPLAINDNVASLFDGEEAFVVEDKSNNLTFIGNDVQSTSSARLDEALGIISRDKDSNNVQAALKIGEELGELPKVETAAANAALDALKESYKGNQADAKGIVGVISNSNNKQVILETVDQINSAEANRTTDLAKNKANLGKVNSAISNVRNKEENLYVAERPKLPSAQRNFESAKSSKASAENSLRSATNRKESLSDKLDNISDAKAQNAVLPSQVKSLKRENVIIAVNVYSNMKDYQYELESRLDYELNKPTGGGSGDTQDPFAGGGGSTQDPFAGGGSGDYNSALSFAESISGNNNLISKAELTSAGYDAEDVRYQLGIEKGGTISTEEFATGIVKGQIRGGSGGSGSTQDPFAGGGNNSDTQDPFSYRNEESISLIKSELGNVNEFLRDVDRHNYFGNSSWHQRGQTIDDKLLGSYFGGRDLEGASKAIMNAVDDYVDYNAYEARSAQWDRAWNGGSEKGDATLKMYNYMKSADNSFSSNKSSISNKVNQFNSNKQLISQERNTKKQFESSVVSEANAKGNLQSKSANFENASNQLSAAKQYVVKDSPAAKSALNSLNSAKGSAYKVAKSIDGNDYKDMGQVNSLKSGLEGVINSSDGQSMANGIINNQKSKIQ